MGNQTFHASYIQCTLYVFTYDFPYRLLYNIFLQIHLYFNEIDQCTNHRESNCFVHKYVFILNNTFHTGVINTLKCVYKTLLATKILRLLFYFSQFLITVDSTQNVVTVCSPHKMLPRKLETGNILLLV